MKVKYVGGIKNGGQICRNCGHRSGDVKDFCTISGLGEEPLLIDEQCLNCWGKEQQYPDPDKL